MKHEDEVKLEENLTVAQLKEGVALARQIVGVEKAMKRKGLDLSQQRTGLVKKFETLLSLLPQTQPQESVEVLRDALRDYRRDAGLNPEGE